MAITRDTQRSDQQLSSSSPSKPQKQGKSKVGAVPLLSQREGRTDDFQYYVSDDDEHVHSRSHFTSNKSKQRKCHADEIYQNQNERSIPRPRQIPNEILACIINHVAKKPQLEPLQDDNRQLDQQRDLYACTLVNKQFYAIVNPMLWQEPVLDADPTHLQRLLDCLAATENPLGQYVRKLRLHTSTGTDNQLLCLMTHVRSLETLSLENEMPFDDDIYAAATAATAVASITNTSLQQLPRYCSQLTCLVIVNMDLSEATIRAIGQHCLRLNEITMFLSVEPWEGIFSALSHCPLEKLSMTCNNEQWGTLTEQMVTDITAFQGLVYLRLSLFKHSSLIMTCTNKTVPWPHLKLLSLDHCGEMNDAAFICFIKTHPHLQTIHLEGAALTDASLKAMAKFPRELRELILFGVNGISSGGVCRLIQKRKGLMFAQFYQCDQIIRSDVLETYDDDGDHLFLDEMDLVNIRKAQGTGNIIHWLANKFSVITGCCSLV